PLADVAYIRADHESKQMLGVDALCIDAGWKQPGKAQDCPPERSCSNWHPHSEGHGEDWKLRRSSTNPITGGNRRRARRAPKSYSSGKENRRPESAELGSGMESKEKPNGQVLA